VPEAAGDQTRLTASEGDPLDDSEGWSAGEVIAVPFTQWAGDPSN